MDEKVAHIDNKKKTECNSYELHIIAKNVYILRWYPRFPDTTRVHHLIPTATNFQGDRPFRHIALSTTLDMPVNHHYYNNRSSACCFYCCGCWAPAAGSLLWFYHLSLRLSCYILLLVLLLFAFFSLLLRLFSRCLHSLAPACLDSLPECHQLTEPRATPAIVVSRSANFLPTIYI